MYNYKQLKLRMLFLEVSKNYGSLNRTVLMYFNTWKQKLSNHCCTNHVDVINLISGSLRDCYFRPIEKGGLLVGAKPSDIDVILQMPRGNLEVNICRLMVIDKLEKLLDFHKWKDAFELIQMQKLNSNLLVDLNAKRFLENIEQFLTEIKSNVMIVNFLLELVEENVLETLYKNCRVATCFTNKINSVCKKVVETAQRLDSAYYVQSIMIARIKLGKYVGNLKFYNKPF